MMKAVWYYIKMTALKWHIRPAGLFLAVHTILWCDIAWIACRLGCDIIGIPPALHSMDILLITAYSGIFPGIIGGAFYLMHEDLV